MNLIVFILVCFGLTQILAYGSIFDAIRPEHKFFHCPRCLGFWVGILIFILFWLVGIHMFPNPYLGAILFGFLSSGTSYILCQIVGDDGINIKRG